jgi:hypothetical protein
MHSVLRLSAVTSMALAATVMGASAAGAATHGHKPGNCSVKKKGVTFWGYHAVAVTVVCHSHGGVSRSTMLSPSGKVTVSRKGNETIVRDSDGNVSEMSGGSVVSHSDSSGGGNYSKTVTTGGKSIHISGSAGSAVNSVSSAVSNVSSSQSSSQSSQ